ncbi:MAG: alpha/beta fold hydrolase, partial [Rubrobacteraceae bacterium]
MSIRRSARFGQSNSDGGRRRTEARRPLSRRIFVSVLLAVAIFVVVMCWSWIGAQARAVIVLSSVLETPVLTPAIEALTREPVVEDTVFAGQPALVMKPEGEGPWPAILFVNGTIAEGREYPEVQNLARGLARAGYLVVVPDLPGLTTDEITGETVSSAAQLTRAVANRPDARDGKTALIGVSTGATLSLLAAEDPEVATRVSVVAGVAPYTDIRTVLDIAT